MYSISEFSKLTGLSTRALRYYEQMGLLEPETKSFSNHRRYSPKDQLDIEKILFLKECGFTIKEIQEFLLNQNSIKITSLITKFTSKLATLNSKINEKLTKKKKLEDLLYVLRNLKHSEHLDVFKLSEENMNHNNSNFRNELINFIKSKNNKNLYINYIEREDATFYNLGLKDFVKSSKKLIDFAKNRDINVGFLRGGASSSLYLYKLGISTIDPVIEGLFPERWNDTGLKEIHFDAEFSRANEIKEFAKEINQSLEIGKFLIFKSPILEIIKNVEKSIGKTPNYHEYDFDSDIILKPLNQKDISYIFAHDLGNSLLAKMSNFNIDNDQEYLASMNINSYKDLLNAVALVNIDRNHSSRRRKLYLEAKFGQNPYLNILSDAESILSDTYGMLIYQKDVANLIRFYTNWDFKKCDLSRRVLGKKNTESPLYKEIESTLPKDIFNILKEETPFTWCKAHLLSEREITRKTIILKTFYKNEFIKEINRFEETNNVSWAEIGFKTQTISNLC